MGKSSLTSVPITPGALFLCPELGSYAARRRDCLLEWWGQEARVIKDVKKMAKDTTKNLIPFGERTEDEERQIRVKGGKKSGEVRREKKLFRDVIRALLQGSVPDEEKVQALLMRYGLDPSKADILDTINLAQVDKALNGDLAAAMYLRDTAGEKPKDKVEMEGGPGTLNVIYDYGDKQDG